jgi:hypothetical protein
MVKRYQRNPLPHSRGSDFLSCKGDPRDRPHPIITSMSFPPVVAGTTYSPIITSTSFPFLDGIVNYRSMLTWSIPKFPSLRPSPCIDRGHG